MSGWSTAIAALQAQLDGVSVQVSGLQAESLDALTAAPGGRQDVQSGWPYAFPLPRGRKYQREPGAQRVLTAPLVVRVLLAPKGVANISNLHRRYDAWVDALVDALDDAVRLDGTVEFYAVQDFGPLSFFQDIDVGWGFDMTLEDLEIHETITPGP